MAVAPVVQIDGLATSQAIGWNSGPQVSTDGTTTTVDSPVAVTNIQTDGLDVCDAYVSSAVASAAITATTYLNVLANATIATAGQTGSEWTVDDTNKRLTYTGTATRKFIATLSVSMITSRSNTVASFRLAENGTTAAATQVDRKIGTGADVGALVCQGTFSLATNDYIELWGTLAASTSDTITVNYCNISIRPVS